MPAFVLPELVTDWSCWSLMAQLTNLPSYQCQVPENGEDQPTPAVLLKRLVALVIQQQYTRDLSFLTTHSDPARLSSLPYPTQQQISFPGPSHPFYRAVTTILQLDLPPCFCTAFGIQVSPFTCAAGNSADLCNLVSWYLTLHCGLLHGLTCNCHLPARSTSPDCRLFQSSS